MGEPQTPTRTTGDLQATPPGLGTPAASNQRPATLTSLQPLGVLAGDAAAAAATSSAASTPRQPPPPSSSSLPQGASPLRRGASRSPTAAAGLQTYGSKYMPFAAGFVNMAAEAPVYRSPRLHNLDPTAAADEGSTRHYYTLDSGVETPATRAANAESSSGARAEHVRNTAAASDHSGALGRLFAPIR